MHSFSKKFYYDVMKSGQEDTILESHSDDEDDQEDSRSGRPTLEVGCSVWKHTKSNAVQTQWSRGGRNFRNEYTSTSDLVCDAMTLKTCNSNVYAIHESLSCEDITVPNVCSVQTSSNYPPNQDCESVAVEVFGLGILNNLISAAVEDERIDQCTGTECKQADQCESCNCSDDFETVPCNRGLTACRNFTLGTAEFRRYQNEGCRTKLIGGSRVPVCKSHMNSF